MALSSETAPFGPRAFEAIAAAVARAQRGDRLAPVTVVVATNTAGVMLRRRLGRHGGVAGAQFITLYRLAELVAGTRLASAGRRPASMPVLSGAIRAALAETPGPLHTESPHPETVATMFRLHRELRELADPMLARLRDHGSPLGRAIHDVHRLVRRRLAPAWHDESDLLDAAITHAPHAPAAVGAIVIACPGRLSASAIRLIRALSAHRSVHVVLGLTGDGEADAAAGELAKALGIACPPVAAVAWPRLDVLDVTDADDEVRVAIRHLLDAARAGMPFDRMAVLWTASDPYARTVAEQLDVAGLAWNGPSPQRLAERVAPRTLLGLLDIDRWEWRRGEVFGLLNGAPVLGADRRPAPVAAWERIARDAGVRGGTDWDERLARLATQELARRGADGDGGHDEVAADRAHRRADLALELRAYILDLHDRLGEPATTRPWNEWADLAHRLLRHLLGGDWMRRRLPPDEQHAFDTLEVALDRLRGVDDFLAPIDRAGFREMLVAELDQQLSRHGHIGTGIHLGSLASAATLDVDLLVVLGAVDGLFPRAVRPDPLLGERDRRIAGLPERPGESSRADQRRAWLAALATASRVIVGAPRGDLRRSATRLEGRWLAELATHPGLRRIAHASHVDALATTEFPVHDGEFIGRALLGRVRSGGTIDDHPAVSDPALGAGLAMVRARARPTLTAYDGDLSGLDVPVPFLAGSPVAPTRLERWASCPYAYFMRHVLHVDDDDTARDSLLISPIDRGTLVHTALERFGRSVIDEQWPSVQPWSTEHRQRLHRILDEVADERSKLGLTGHPGLWVFDLRHLHDDLDVALDVDDEVRSTGGRQIVGAETAFGVGGASWPAPVVELASGQRITFRGAVDRVDTTPDGIVVTDYKTGKGVKYRAVSATDPLGGQTLLQLAVYAAAAAQATGIGLANVGAEYRLVERRLPPDKAVRGMSNAIEGWDVFTGALEVITDGIVAGLFPARPEPPGFRLFVDCRYCDPDGGGTGDRHREWVAKRADPRLARYVSLIGDAEPDSDADGD